ncbi:hypothetical protein MRS60_07775 [Burkholderia pyrrocinia]|uniref:hypothetical protein n=1 Tax=Burkholderia pyrrocinia TaxID=60550 RepID=UPI001FB5297E|nr:hypothetical protein [Burkholderia pyrrocinia]UOB56988.1 hypothetical protein MRS60_07775 [Burkholderia pyrrocinia]
MNHDEQSSTGKPQRPATGSHGTKVDIPGGKRMDFPDGSYVCVGPNGERFLVSEAGNISANLPFIRHLQIHDVSQVVRHEIVQIHETISHTVHFSGGGVLGYLHWRDGRGISLEGYNIDCRLLPEGIVLVLGAVSDRSARGGQAPFSS